MREVDVNFAHYIPPPPKKKEDACIVMDYLLSSGTAIIDEPLRVAYLGGETTFTCLCTPIIRGHIEHIQWKVNETRVELIQTDGIVVENIRNVGHLHFINVSVEHNDTNIQCIIYFSSREMIRSNNAILFVQG